MHLPNRKLNWLIAILVIVIASVIYIRVSSVFPQTDQRNIRLEELFALTGLTFLYSSLLPNPLSRIFSNSKFIQNYKSLQPALVGATLFFGGIHAYIAFFFLLGGFEGLGFLNKTFITGISLSLTALTMLIITTLCLWLKKKITWVANLPYIVGVLIIIHAMLLGTDFIDLSRFIPQFVISAVLFLLFLEIVRLDKFIRQKKTHWPNFGPIFAILVIGLSLTGYYLFTNTKALPSASVHSGHIMNPATNSQGRYTVSFISNPPNPRPGQNVNLTFKVFDAASGTQINDFALINTKLLHLVIVDGSLNFFNHIHPELNQGDFTIATQFPKDDIYHLYLNFQPATGSEQQVGLSLPVGTGIASLPDPNPSALTKTFGNVAVSLEADDLKPFSAQTMSNASQIINFNFKDAQTGQPITDIQPYLGAFGHLVLINEQNYNYVHVHPLASSFGDFAGPTIQFMPAALYEPIMPGIYRVFGQFQRNNQLFVVDFTININ